MTDSNTLKEVDSLIARIDRLKPPPEEKLSLREINESSEGALNMLNSAFERSQLPEFLKVKNEEESSGEYIFQVGQEVWGIDRYDPQRVTVFRTELKEGERLEKLELAEGLKWADLEEARMVTLLGWAERKNRVFEWGLAQTPGVKQEVVMSYHSDKIKQRNTSTAVGYTETLFIRAAKVLTGEVPAPVPSGV